jgi:hypothetical protein
MLCPYGAREVIVSLPKLISDQNLELVRSFVTINRAQIIVVTPW